jgi:hypothetical protein
VNSHGGVSEDGPPSATCDYASTAFALSADFTAYQLEVKHKPTGTHREDHARQVVGPENGLVELLTPQVHLHGAGTVHALSPGRSSLTRGESVLRLTSLVLARKGRSAGHVRTKGMSSAVNDWLGWSATNTILTEERKSVPVGVTFSPVLLQRRSNAAATRRARLRLTHSTDCSRPSAARATPF